MLNRETSICYEYAEAAFRRATQPLEPPDFVPVWRDHPSLYTLYKDVERLVLPLELPSELLSFGQLMEGLAIPGEQALPTQALTLEKLAIILYFAHGVLSRRLKIHPDQRANMVAKYFRTDLYARGTASGGGLYPTEIYLISGPGSTVDPGIYHYDNAHHSLEQLSIGDATPAVRSAAFSHPAALEANQFLLVTLNFWKNTFKYNNFGYHVMTQDTGALLCSLWFLFLGYQTNWHPIYWFNDEKLNELLGLKTEIESVLAVIPLSMGEKPVTRSVINTRSEHVVQHTTFQRSQNIHLFARGQKAHFSTLLTGEDVLNKNVLTRENVPVDKEEAGTDERILLPLPELSDLQDDILDVFQQRRSSFGTFSAFPKLSQQELVTMLHAGALARNYNCDVKLDAGTPSFTRQAVFINNVEGIQRGVYDYDADTRSLVIIKQADMALFLQQHYFLQNYSLSEVGAVIVIIGNLDAMLETYGNRGYRLLNMEAGMIAQSLYMASTSLSVACGAALGFNNIAMNSELNLASGQKTLLFVLVGHELKNTGDIDYRFV